MKFSETLRRLALETGWAAVAPAGLQLSEDSRYSCTTTGDSRMLHPLEDSRWAEFIQKHSDSSVFHTNQWLEALLRTYRYEPVVITSSPAGEALHNGFVLCRVNSWLTGKRLVSLPFSDYCAPLVNEASELDGLFFALDQRLEVEKLRYVEIRPSNLFVVNSPHFHTTCRFWHHKLDLTPNLDTIFENCHKDSTQRKIRRAEKEGLAYEEGRSTELLDIFYELMIVTRRRHHVPPQPKAWFTNLVDCFGEMLKIRVAFKDRVPTASILTLEHKDILTYKYGCSDSKFNNLGGTQMLFWKSIEEAKNRRLRLFDLGRSDLDNAGLVTFKDRWGTIRSTLTYSRYTRSAKSSDNYVDGSPSGWKENFAKRTVSRLPGSALRIIGNVLYRHVG